MDLRRTHGEAKAVPLLWELGEGPAGMLRLSLLDQARSETEQVLHLLRNRSVLTGWGSRGAG